MMSQSGARLPTVDSPVEYGLYALAIRCPDLFANAEQFTGGMLAEDQDALRRVKALIEGYAARKIVAWDDGGRGDINWVIMDGTGKVLSRHTDLTSARSAMERA